MFHKEGIEPRTNNEFQVTETVWNTETIDKVPIDHVNQVFKYRLEHHLMIVVHKKTRSCSGATVLVADRASRSRSITLMRCHGIIVSKTSKSFGLTTTLRYQPSLSPFA